MKTVKDMTSNFCDADLNCLNTCKTILINMPGRQLKQITVTTKKTKFKNICTSCKLP